MQNEVISSIFDRFPYLSTDVCVSHRNDHPQVIYSDYNSFDLAQVNQFARDLDQIAQQWASLDAPETDPAFAHAIQGLRPMINAVSATSLILLHRGDLLVERPGLEVEKQRRGEIMDFYEGTQANWEHASPEDRLSLARLSLLGIAPLQMELVNYLDIAEVPTVIGKMLSRLDQISGTHKCEKMGAETALSHFSDLEHTILSQAGLTRIGIPVGTRPRVYVPADVVSMDAETYDASVETLKNATNRVDSIINFLSLVWRDFADEAFMVLHEDNDVNAYALVGGCCYHYHAKIDPLANPPSVNNESKITFISTAGDYVPREWRRDFPSLCFDNGTEGMVDFRKQVIELEALPVEQRADDGQSGYLAKAAQRLLNRQINYNISHVLAGKMERISAIEWSPNMCRDQYGRIYNQPHAIGGVGEMFRSLLSFGGRSSQFRTWREKDGTHGFQDIRRFVGYATALDHFLTGPNLTPQLTQPFTPTNA